MPLLDYAAITAKARNLRRKAKLNGPPYSSKLLLERCFPEIHVTGQKLPERVTEIADVTDGKRTIFYNSRLLAPEHRVGVVHGLAHHLFDLTESRMECELRFTEHQADQQMRERRADLFAAEILVPMVDLDQLIGPALEPKKPVDFQMFNDEVDHLSSRFNVPRDFLRWRISDLMHLRRTNFFLYK